MKTYRPGAAAKYRERYANDPEFRAKRKQYQREYYAKHPHRKTQTQERMQSYHRNYKYGMTVEIYERMSAEQNHVCAICGGLPTRTKNLHVDHCHETGVVRGLLCDSCNLGLGKFRDDPVMLDKAAAYLRASADG